jgi:transcriptional regulator with XRE-family HTH domain
MGNQLREIRKGRRLSLRKLGEMSGMDHSVIAKIERGDVRLASHHIEILSSVLGVRPEELISNDAPLSEREREFLTAIEGLTDDNLDRVIDLARALTR